MHLRILVIRLSSLGDIVLTFPLLDALRNQYPDATIDVLTKQEYAPFVKKFTSVSHVFGLDPKIRSEDMQRQLRAKHYDHVIDLHNNWRSIAIRKNLAPLVHIINKRSFRRWMLAKFKADLLAKTPDVVGRYFEAAAPLGILDSGKGAEIDVRSPKTSTIAIAPGAKHWNKQWPVDNYIRVGKELTKRGYKIVILGSTAEQGLGEEIADSVPHAVNECGKYQLDELPEVLSRCALFIGNDSGLMHIAGALGLPTIAIFGPTVREFGFMPRNENVKILEVSGLDCRPCTTIGLDHCPKGHFRCMKDTSPRDVITALNF